MTFNPYTFSNHALGCLYLKNLEQLLKISSNDPEYNDITSLHWALTGEIIESFIKQYCPVEYDEHIKDMEDF